ncbi:MAG: V-type ATP synthase subunit I [Bacillota bacterium]
MAIVKTNLVRITAHIDYMDPTLERFVDLDCIHPVEGATIAGQVRGSQTFHTESPCNLSLQELQEIEDEFDVKIEPIEPENYDYSVDKVCDLIHSIHGRLKSLVSRKKEIEDSIKKYEDALIQVQHIESLDIALDEIFSCDYVYARVGRLPNDSIEKLRFHRSRPFIFQSFTEDSNYSWCMYLTTNRHKREVDNIFSSLFFERIHIPDFVKGTPENAQMTLKREISALQEKLDDLQHQINAVLEDSDDDLALFKGELLFVDKINDAKDYVVGLGNKFTITGFVEENDEDQIKDKFADMEEVEVEILPPDHDKRLKPPTRIKNGWFSRPFDMFVEMYGMPSVKDIDPTPFVAYTYALLFGIMFGDVGQGLLFMILGWLLYRYKGMQLGQVGIRIGIFSMLFGFLYGSVFGNEEILNPLWRDVLGFENMPLHVLDPSFTMTLLIGAVGLGSILILMSIGINIALNIKNKHYAEVFMSHNGVAGIIFYLFVLAGLALQIGMGIQVFSLLTVIPFAILPLIAVLMKEPVERKLHGGKLFPEGIGGFITEGFFELFEVVLSYTTNTMSFMRVAGFVLSHAGMMLVVYTLMDMGGGLIASTIIFIIGNLFVMALEGMIVGIQVLRLEFYEMFSRYYEGNGIRFRSLGETQ